MFYHDVCCTNDFVSTFQSAIEQYNYKGKLDNLRTVPTNKEVFLHCNYDYAGKADYSKLRAIGSQKENWGKPLIFQRKLTL